MNAPTHYAIDAVQLTFRDGRSTVVGPFDNDDDSGSWAAAIAEQPGIFSAYRTKVYATDYAWAVYRMAGPENWTFA